MRRRRLFTICRIARCFKAAAASLLRDLGFVDVLQVLRSESRSPEEKAVVDELLHYAQSA